MLHRTMRVMGKPDLHEKREVDHQRVGAGKSGSKYFPRVEVGTARSL